MNRPQRGDPNTTRWLETNVVEQKQTGYAAVIVRVDQGNLTSDQMRGLARIAGDAGDGLVRVDDRAEPAAGLHSAGQLPQVHAALGEDRAWRTRARARSMT